MMPDRKIDEIKHCVVCKRQLIRRRSPSGRLEGADMFATRQYCSIVCANSNKPSETRRGPRHRDPIAERLERSIEREPNGGCWLWTGEMHHKGYGRIRIDRVRSRAKTVNGKSAFAHRVSYEQHVGPIPDGLTLDHLCRVRRCVNPAHLEPVTAAENTRRGDHSKKLNAEQVAEIRQATGTHAEIAKKYDVNPSLISRIKTGEVWASSNRRLP